MKNKKDLKLAVKGHVSWLESMMLELDGVSHNAKEFEFTYSEDIEEITKKLNKMESGKCAGVYGIFVQPEFMGLVVSELTKFKNAKSETLHVTPKPNLHESQSGCLYVGKCKKNISSRLKQHLHNGPVKTAALKAFLWSKKLKSIKFTVYYYPFPNENHQLVRELEKALWNYYKPAVGKL